jgi:hypothetical protein
MYFNSFKIETDKNKSENINKLKEFVCTDKQPFISLNFDFKGKPFFGTITDNKFDIMPVIEGRNSFVPVMKGEIIGDNQSVVIVKMRLHSVVIAFIALITLFMLWTMRNDLQNGGLIVLPVLYSVTVFLYLRESKKYKMKFESYFK